MARKAVAVKTVTKSRLAAKAQPLEVEPKPVNIPINKPKSVLDELDEETPAESKADRLYLEAEGQVELSLACQTLFDAVAAKKEAETEYDASKDALREIVDPWRNEQCSSGHFGGTVDLDCGEYLIQMQYKQFNALPVEKEKTILKIVGPEAFAELFERKRTFAIAKHVCKDTEVLESVVSELIEKLGAVRFKEIFERKTLVGTCEKFDAKQFKLLNDTQRQQLLGLGFSQTVAPVAKTKKDNKV